MSLDLACSLKGFAQLTDSMIVSSIRTSLGWEWGLFSRSLGNENVSTSYSGIGYKHSHLVVARMLKRNDRSFNWVIISLKFTLDLSRHLLPWLSGELVSSCLEG